MPESVRYDLAAPPAELRSDVASAIYDEANVVESTPEMTGPFPRNVVWLIFNPEATAAEKRAALDSVEGRVIGGQPINAGGIYYVLIKDDGTARPLFRAIATLEALPQVEYASPDLTLMLRPNS